MMDNNEVLRHWLTNAWELRGDVDCIAHKVEGGMPLTDAWREVDTLFGREGRRTLCERLGLSVVVLSVT